MSSLAGCDLMAHEDTLIHYLDTMSSLALRSLAPYNPNWRKTINGKLGIIPDNMVLRHQLEVQDAETVFDETGK